MRTQGQPSAEPTADQDHGPTPGSSKALPQPVPVGATNKMLARAEWEKQVEEAADEEESDLEVFEEAEGNADADADIQMTDEKASEQISLPVGTGEPTLTEYQPGMFNS